MAPPLRATAEAESSTAVASLDATVPASTADGDVVVVLAGASASATYAALTGYTNLADERAGAAAYRLGVWYKVATGGDAGATVTPTLSTGTGRMVVQVRVYHSVDATTPLDATTTVATSDTNDTAVVAPAITTVTDGAWTVSAHGQPTTTGTTIADYTDPTGATNEVFSCSTDASGNQAALASYDYDTGVAGPYGPYTATSPQARRWAAVTLALRPATGGATGTAAAALGALTATATGQRTVTGTAAAALGALTATAAGARTVTGTATTDLGALTAAATGQRTVAGTATAALGALTAAATVVAAVLSSGTPRLTTVTRPVRSTTGTRPPVTTGTRPTRTTT